MKFPLISQYFSINVLPVNTHKVGASHKMEIMLMIMSKLFLYNTNYVGLIN